MVNAQTRAATQPRNVQPSNRVTTQIAPLLWCLRPFAINPGKSHKAIPTTIATNPKNSNAIEPAAPAPALPTVDVNNIYIVLFVSSVNNLTDCCHYWGIAAGCQLILLFFRYFFAKNNIVPAPNMIGVPIRKYHFMKIRPWGNML